MSNALAINQFDEATRLLVDRYQRDFPLSPQPFALIGDQLGLREADVIERLARLREIGAVSRVGAVVRPNAAGASTLAAIAAPPADIERIAGIVNSQRGVNHNYEREHEFNLWFVVTGRTGDDVHSAIDEIERETGLDVLDLPLEQSYHIDLGFPLFDAPSRNAPCIESREVAGEADVRLLAAIESGLPLTPRPYAVIAGAIGEGEDAVIDRLASMQARGIVKRFGVVVRHRAFGYDANAMAVWDVPDAAVDRVAARFVEAPQVTLCYRRPRRPPRWRYNLFTMVHGVARDNVLDVIGGLTERARGQCDASAVLFSRRCFKQRGATFVRREAQHADA
ncbi:MAG: hypothetical protein JNK46_08385 [Methylobacteriaceae bacterium]|nr:hypothetical protein [Methylobacteriaceae bacterium]